MAPPGMVIEYGADGHDGPGWYFWSEEYPEEGSSGHYATREEAEEAAALEAGECADG